MQNEKKEKEQPKDRKPNEAGSIQVDTHIKIFDPNTQEVFVNKRDS